MKKVKISNDHISKRHRTLNYGSTFCGWITFAFRLKPNAACPRGRGGHHCVPPLPLTPPTPPHTDFLLEKWNINNSSARYRFCRPEASSLTLSSGFWNCRQYFEKSPRQVEVPQIFIEKTWFFSISGIGVERASKKLHKACQWPCTHLAWCPKGFQVISETFIFFSSSTFS